jgi:hypothetical protein
MFSTQPQNTQPQPSTLLGVGAGAPPATVGAQPTTAGSPAASNPLLGGGKGSDITSGILGALGSYLSGQKIAGGYGDYEDQMRQIIESLTKAQGQGLGFLQPFQSAGATAVPQVQKMLSLLQNPLMARQFLMRGFSQSPEAKAQLEEGTRASNAAAAAGGTLGSGAQRAALQQFGQEVQSRDVDKYLGQQQDLFGKALSGEQGQEQLGLSAGSSMANFLAQLQQALAGARSGLGIGEIGEATAGAGGLSGALSSIASVL